MGCRLSIPAQQIALVDAIGGKMISNRLRTWYAWVATIALMAGCTSTPLSSPHTTPLTTGELPSAEGTASSPDDFPRTPNPIAVHATLDPAHAASNATWQKPGQAYNFSVDGESADGIQFSLSMPGALLSQDADGNLLPAFGSVVTVTPVSAIADIPFSKGYLAAVQIGPEGLLMVEPGTLSLTFPGDYDVSKLIGFAADGTGGDFHLFPMQASSSDGTTYVYFSPAHFSLYGIAQATFQEIEAQSGHPPANPASQDESELAPLLPLVDPADDAVTPLKTKIQLQLGKSYNRLVKRDLDRLPDLSCDKVASAAYNLNAWKAMVETANQTANFEQQINQDATTLLNRLTKCAKVTCANCLNNTTGKKLDKAAVNKLLVLASFAGDMATILGRMDEASYWMQLSNKCAVEAGLPPAGPSGAGDCTGPQCQTSVPLVCK
jgi:hypothetical protein